MSEVGESRHVYGRVDDGIGTIVLNRPDRRNAMSEEMIAGLEALLREYEDSPDVRVIVLTGAGNAFCAGGDVKDFDENGGEGGGSDQVDEAALAEQRRVQEATVGRIYRNRTPVVAAIPGPAAGAGLGLALAADFRIASDRAVIATAFAAVGLAGDFGVAWLLHHLAGPARARELLMLNPRVKADEALRMGLVTEVVPHEHFPDRVQQFARALADGPRTALSSIKDNLVRADTQTLEQNMHDEVLLHKQTGLTDDHIGAVRAFIDKRTPTFNRN